MNEKQPEQKEALLMSQISTELSDPEHILQAVQAQKIAIPSSSVPPEHLSSVHHEDFVLPRTPTEKKLATIWAEFLEIEQLSIYDHFFDLGGDSIVAVQVLSRVYDVFQVEFSLDILFTIDDTLAEFATIIDQHLIEQVDEEKMLLLLQDVKKLSDDEVREILAQEEHITGE